jgi:two-component sensor histidine kinase
MAKAHHPTGFRQTATGQVNGYAESNHRIANSLHMASTLLRAQRRRATDSEVQSALLSAEVRLLNIGRVHSYLQGTQTEDWIDLLDYLPFILPQIGSAIGMSCRLSTKAAKPVLVTSQAATKLALVINELALNALKHGYDAVPGGSVTLTLDCRPDGGLQLCFADEGAGLPDDFSLGNARGLGMRIITSNVAELGGTIAAVADRGARFIIQLPASLCQEDAGIRLRTGRNLHQQRPPALPGQ